MNPTPLVIGDWVSLIPAVLIATLVLWIPGLTVVAATTRLRVWALAAAPAVTVGLIGVAGVLGGLLGVRWTTLVLGLFAVVVAAVAMLIRRLTRADGGTETTTRRHAAAFAVGTAAAAMITAAQVARLIGDPHAIAQRFDNIFHLNAVQHVLHSGDASSLGLVDFTGNVFYQMGWHSLTALVAQLSGVAVPTAVTATNVAIAATAWTMGCAALVAVVRPHNWWLPAVGALLSTGFGAFPYRLLDFGVLYPNFLSIALLPGVLALALRVLGLPSETARPERGEVVVRVLLLLVAATGLVFAQPNGLMTLLAMCAVPLVVTATARTRRARAQGDVATARWTVVMTTAALVLGAVAWQVARPPAAAITEAGWAPWQGVGDAVRSALLMTVPWDTPVWLIIGVLVLGLVALLLSPRDLWAAAPFGVAVLLYASASALPVGSAVREYLTGPYFHDAERLAAILPVGAVVVGALGVDLVGRAAALVRTRWTPGAAERDGRRGRAVGVAGAVTVGAIVAAGVTVGNPNVTGVLRHGRLAYEPGWLLSVEERDLLYQLPELTDRDALIAVNPHTGASFAFALGERVVTAPHVFFTSTDALNVVAARLDEIDTDPEVCEAVLDAGIDYALDFGTKGVLQPATAWLGFDQLEAGRHLELVAQTGPQARLFRVNC